MPRNDSVGVEPGRGRRDGDEGGGGDPISVPFRGPRRQESGSTTPRGHDLRDGEERKGARENERVQKLGRP